MSDRHHSLGAFVAIEGPTGVGKTTLVSRLAPLLEADAMFDPFESNPFLAALAAADTPERERDLGLLTEFTFLALRVAQLRHIAQRLASGHMVLTDWCLVKQSIFANITLEGPDRHRFTETCALWSVGLPTPDLVVYLVADVITISRRIESRGRPMESGLDTADISALIASYNASLAGSRVPVITLDYSEFDAFDDVRVAELAEFIREKLIDSRASINPVPIGAASEKSMTNYRRLVFTAPGRVELIEELLPPLRSGEVYARPVISGVSQGTEMAWFHGKAAALHRMWDADRRIYLNGPGRDFPVAPGYETIALVTELATDVTVVKVGDMVYLDRPHAEMHVVEAASAAAGLLPKGLEAEKAIFWTLARVALGGVHDASIRLGETVVVIGLGTVGLLAIQIARMEGARKVVGVDRYRLRLDTAVSLGADVIDAGGVEDVAVEVRRYLGVVGADVAIEASGSYVGLHEAIRACRVGGRVVTIASYHGRQEGLRLGEEYHRNRITMISSMTVNGCPQRGFPSWTLERLNDTARDLIALGKLRVDSLLTHRIPFSKAEDAYSLVSQTPQDTIKVALTYAD